MFLVPLFGDLRLSDSKEFFDAKKLFAGPPILPWFRVDTKKPVKPQLLKSRILKAVVLRPGGVRGPLRFPELFLVKPPVAAKASRRHR